MDPLPLRFFFFLLSLPAFVRQTSFPLCSCQGFEAFLYSLPKMASGTSAYDVHAKYLLISHDPSGIWNPCSLSAWSNYFIL